MDSIPVVGLVLAGLILIVGMIIEATQDKPDNSGFEMQVNITVVDKAVFTTPEGTTVRIDADVDGGIFTMRKLTVDPVLAESLVVGETYEVLIKDRTIIGVVE